MEKKLNDCLNCGKDVPCHRPEQQKWAFHIFMFFMTMGLWLPVMIYIANKAPDPQWKCVKCGEVVETPVRWWQWVLIFLLIGVINMILAPFVLPIMFG